MTHMAEQTSNGVIWKTHVGSEAGEAVAQSVRRNVLGHSKLAPLLT